MRKTQLALAAVALVASSVALAEVKVSGRVEMSAQNVSGPGDNATNNLAGYNLAGSEIKFTGDEDLGGGLKANFYLATGFDASRGRLGEGGESGQRVVTAATFAAGDTVAVNQESIFNRGAYVGLSGEFGSINLGRQYTLTTANYATGDVNGGNSNSVLHMVQSGMAQNFWADRAITYASPSFSGFSASAQWIDADRTNVTAAGQSAGRGSSYAVNYSSGDWSASYATMNNGCLNSGGTCWKSSVAGVNAAMGQWKFGVGSTSTNDNTGASTSYFHDAVNPFFRGKSNGWFGSANYTMDSLVLGVSYYTNKRAANTTNADLWALSARYSMSKQTTLFAQHNAAGKQADGAGFLSNYNGVAANAAQGANATFAGILHQF